MQTRVEELSFEKFIEQLLSVWNLYLDTIQILHNNHQLFVSTNDYTKQILLIYLLLLNT